MKERETFRRRAFRGGRPSGRDRRGAGGVGRPVQGRASNAPAARHVRTQGTLQPAVLCSRSSRPSAVSRFSCSRERAPPLIACVASPFSSAAAMKPLSGVSRRSASVYRRGPGATGSFRVRKNPQSRVGFNDLDSRKRKLISPALPLVLRPSGYGRRRTSEESARSRISHPRGPRSLQFPHVTAVAGAAPVLALGRRS